YYLINNNIETVRGFNDTSLQIEISNSGIDVPYNGKWFLIANKTNSPVTLIHNDNLLPYRFYLPNNQNLEIPINGIVMLRYSDNSLVTELGMSGSFELLFKSWNDTKNQTPIMELNEKVTSMSVAMAINALPTFQIEEGESFYFYVIE